MNAIPHSRCPAASPWVEATPTCALHHGLPRPRTATWSSPAPRLTSRAGHGRRRIEPSRPDGGPMGDDAAERRRELTERAAYHADALRRRDAEESAKAQVLIDRFVAQATQMGLPTEELTA